MHSPLRLSIVIPTYNGMQVLPRCLESVNRHRPSASEVIVVDDGSEDETVEWLAAEHPETRVLAIPENRGFCHAVNRGVELAKGDIVETLNNDVIASAGWADAALELFQDPSVASVAPLVWLYNYPGLIDSAGMIYHVAGWARNRGNRERLRGRFQSVEEVFGATASAAFYRLESLRQVGGLPERYVAYYDDVDLAFRLRRAGYRSLYTPFSQVYHLESFSYGRSAKVLRMFFRNEERAFWENVPLGTMWQALPHHLLYLAARSFETACRGTFHHFWAAKLAVLGDLVPIWQRRQWQRRLARNGIRPASLPMERRIAARLHSVLARWRDAQQGNSPLSGDDSLPHNPAAEPSLPNHTLSPGSSRSRIHSTGSTSH